MPTKTNSIAKHSHSLGLCSFTTKEYRIHCKRTTRGGKTGSWNLYTMQSQISRLRVGGMYCRVVNSRFTHQPLDRTKAQCYRLFSDSGKGKDDGSMHLVKAGLPLFLFCGLGVWVVSNGIDGKNRERDAFQGRISKYVKLQSPVLMRYHEQKCL